MIRPARRAGHHGHSPTTACSTMRGTSREAGTDPRRDAGVVAPCQRPARELAGRTLPEGLVAVEELVDRAVGPDVEVLGRVVAERRTVRECPMDVEREGA